MIEIVKSRNDYFIKEDGCFFGCYNSVAEAEYNLETRAKKKVKPLKKFNLIKVCYWG